MSVRRLDPVQPPSFSFTPDNLSWAKRTVAKFPAGKQASAVIQLLWRAQEQDGWVSRPAIEYVGKMLDMAFIRVYEVATFYTMFHLSPVGRKAHIQVCGTTPCMLRGSEDLMAVCKRKIHESPHHVNADGTMSWEEVECLGSCVNAPMAQVFSDTYEDLTPESLEKLIDDFAAGNPVKPGPQNGRQFSMALGGASTLTDKSLYNAPRTFTRVEAPPPPAAAPATPAAAPAATAAPAAAVAPVVTVAPTPAPSQSSESRPLTTASPTAPMQSGLRPVSAASKITDDQKQAAVVKEATSAAPGTVMTEKAQAETGVVRASSDEITKAATKVPAARKVAPPVVAAPVSKKPAIKKAATTKPAAKKSAATKPAAPKKK